MLALTAQHSDLSAKQGGQLHKFHAYSEQDTVCPRPHLFPETTQMKKQTQKVKGICPRPPSLYVSGEDRCPDLSDIGVRGGSCPGGTFKETRQVTMAPEGQKGGSQTKRMEERSPAEQSSAGRRDPESNG